MAVRETFAGISTTGEPAPSEKQAGTQVPLTDSEKKAVREELRRLLASPRFHSSHRCQVMLTYVVEEFLKGNADSLKERNIGIEVFSRDASYDTNSDPVVRMAAGEVRKKLAQYYYDPANLSQVRIELPTGSYVPEFQITDPASGPIENLPPKLQENAEEGQVQPIPAHTQSPIGPKRTFHWFWWLGAGLAVAIACLILLQQSRSKTQDAFERFWAPVVTSPKPVLLCMGQMRATHVQLDPNPSRNPFSTPMKLGPNGDYPKNLPVAVLADAETLANVAGLLNGAKKAYTIRGEASTTFSDLQKGPVVLLGAFNNDWTIRATDSMRFHFGLDPERLAWWIEDRQKPGVKIGETLQSSWHLTEDYALVARTSDPQTKLVLVVVAGITPFATHAAGEFLTNPQYLDDFYQKLPRDSQTKNVEILIRTNIVDGDPGPPQVVASYFW